MAGDHACPVCGSRFTRPQHVTRHMRSHTGDRPYRCTTCGDQFARSDLLSRHVNKCHSGTPAAAALRANKRNHHTTTNNNVANNAAATNNALAHSADVSCDSCLQTRQQCDLGTPCAQCILRKAACTYSTKASRIVGTASNRRVSLPSIVQQPHNSFLYGTQGQPGQTFGVADGQFGLGQYGGEYLSSSLPSLTGAQPVPMPNGQFIGDDTYGMFSNNAGHQYRLSDGNVLPQPGNPQAYNIPLPRLGSLSYASQPSPLSLSKPAPLSQPYVFTDDRSNTLPPLALGGVDPRVDGSQDTGAAAYLQQRRGSLNLPGRSRGYSGGSETYNQFALPSHASSSSLDHPNYHRQSYPGSYNPQGSPASITNRHLDGTRINERLTSRGYNGSINDDNSSVSDFGSNSGAPSPVPSHPSAFSSSSRPTSSAGSLGPSGLEGHGQQAPGDNYVSSLQGAIPLPTPLQLGSFNAFGGATGANDKTPGVSGEVAAAGRSVFPPYQGLEQMNLDEAASFAAAARNAGYPNNSHSNAVGNTWHSQYHPAFGPPTLSQHAILSAGGREKAIAELKDFWSAFISEPLTGGPNGAQSHNSGGSGDGHSLTKQLSLPSLKTPMSSERTSILDLNHPTPKVLYPNGSHNSILGTYKTGDPRTNTSTNPGHAKENKADVPVKQEQQQIAAAEDEENLRSYQEACLKRETPMLRLQPRPKSRLVSSSMSPQNPTSGVPLPAAGDADTTVEEFIKDGSSTAFAAPFPPDSKEARTWNQYRAQAVAATDLHRSASTARTLSKGSTDSASSRPSYKRLPSQTLGPENSKRSRESAVDDEEDLSGGSDGGFQVSYPQPGYVAGGIGGGGIHGAWTRQRSVSSPTSMRPNFDWQTLGAPRN